MRLQIKNPQDFWAGIIFIALGVLALYMSRDYQMGTALEMGPGYFPTWLGGIMMAFGVAICAFAFKVEGEEGEGLELRKWALRPWLVLPATLVVYGLMMDAEIGFVPSLMVLVIGCALAHKDVHWIETIILSVCVTAAAVAIFSYGIGLPYRLFWWSY